MKRWLLIGGVIALFIFAKGWVLVHPKSTAAIVVSAFLLILTEPSEAR